MAFILDASVTASWGLADEVSPLADKTRLLLNNEDALVPQIWWYEVRNLMLVNERRQRLTEKDTANFLQDLSLLPIQIVKGENEDAIFVLARLDRLSFYGAAYLALAQREHLPIATLDKALRSAATAAEVPLLA